MIALLHLLLIDAWAWLVLRILYGTALVTLYMVVESWLNARADGERRGQIFAIYMVVNLGALAVAQQLLRLDSPMTFTLFVLAAIFVCAALMPVTLTRQAQPSLPDAPATDLLQLARIAPPATGRLGTLGLRAERVLGPGAGIREPHRLRRRRGGLDDEPDHPGRRTAAMADRPFIGTP